MSTEETGLVERLRDYINDTNDASLRMEAANRIEEYEITIERLQAEITNTNLNYKECMSRLVDAMESRAALATIIAELQKDAEPVATKLETQQFNCFHVSCDDAKRLRELPVGTKLYTRPPAQQFASVDDAVSAFKDTTATLSTEELDQVRAIFCETFGLVPAQQVEDNNNLTIAYMMGAASVKQAARVPENIKAIIEELLADAMNTAASNGADSRSMPDEYVELALWLSAAPQAPEGV